MRNLAIALSAAVALLAAPVVAQAAPCKDAKGRFVSCPATKSPAKSQAKSKNAAKPAAKKTCKDAKGRFTACKK